jgi:hypothetical protein
MTNRVANVGATERLAQVRARHAVPLPEKAGYAASVLLEKSVSVSSGNSQCPLCFDLWILDRSGRLSAEDAAEDRIHGAQLALEVKRVRERLFIEEFADIRIFGHELAKISF